MSTTIITNATKNAVLPDKVETGKPIVIQLAPEGEYPQFIDDGTDVDGKPLQKEVVQILDSKAMETMVANFEKAKADAEAKGQKYGVLVDADHSSETSTNTAAMGWVTKLFIDPEKGLMAEVEPTSLGAEKINGKVYRFVSGAWTLDDENRPQELVSIGLTNRPNLPVAPMTNAAKAKNGEPSGTPPSDGEGVTKQTQVAAAEADANKDAGKTQNQETQNQEGAINMDLTSIKEKLGLPPEAADEEVMTCIDALIERSATMDTIQNALGYDETATNEEVVEAVNACLKNAEELQAKEAAAEEARVNAEAEQFVEENEDVLPDDEVKAEVKEEYIEDPEKAKATVANFRKVHDRAVLNAKAAATATKPTEPVKKGINWRDARKPAAINSAPWAAAQGDPAKENEIIRNMCAKH